MLVEGKHNKAKIFTDVVEEAALEQVKELCNTKIFSGSKIRMMADIHAGKGCTIGTTMTITDKVVPEHVGIDIGCGLLTLELDESELDLERLDRVINNLIPNGSHNYKRARFSSTNSSDKYIMKGLSQDRMDKALGTLGGGNHMIEVARDEQGKLYMYIHTGSRYVGARVANHYQKLSEIAYKPADIQQVIENLKGQGKHQLIETEIQKLRERNAQHKKLGGYLEGQEMQDYLHDLGLAQTFAKENRECIAYTIVDTMGLNVVGSFDTVHNYIDLDRMILRKGAVSANKGERLIIPINMRDGAIIAVGKGNEDWNYSAPHGAGRVLSRRKARENLDLETFQEQMSNVWTTSVSEETLDEAPDAYKRKEDIVNNIGDTVEITHHLKPIYNFKAKEELKFWQKKRNKR